MLFKNIKNKLKGNNKQDNDIEAKKLQEVEERKQEEARRLKLYNDLINDAPLKVEILPGNAVKRNNLSTMPEIKYSNITRTTNIDKLFPMVAIDTETTGLRKTERIVEISALKIMPDFVLAERFSTLINPERHIPEEATKINGITDAMVADAPTFGEIVQSLQDFIAGCTVIGHNLQFDLDFLYCSGLKLSEKAKYIDTLDIAKKMLKQGSLYKSSDFMNWDVTDYKLDTLCRYYGIYRPENHRAEADALATAALLEKLIIDKTS